MRLAIINAVLRDVATKQDLERLREQLREEMERLKRYVDTRIQELKEYVDGRLHVLEEQLKQLREEVRELRDRLWWVVATVILGWLVVIVEQLLLFILVK